MAKSGDFDILREFTIDDYQEFSSWWEEAAPPIGALPKIGMVSGDMKAVGFLANTDTDFGIMTWWHASPDNSPKESFDALNEIVKGCIEAAQIIGKKYVFCYTSRRSMIRLLEHLSFNQIDTGHMALKVV